VVNSRVVGAGQRGVALVEQKRYVPNPYSHLGPAMLRRGEWTCRNISHVYARAKLLRIPLRGRPWRSASQVHMEATRWQWWLPRYLFTGMT
jgi:hypothetical protein